MNIAAMDVRVFGYGSLINAASLAKTIGRTLRPDEFIPALLMGYSRIWNYRAEVFSDSLNRNIQSVYLNVAETAGAQANGLIFKVTQAELALLKIRERNYAFVDITGKISGNSGNPVFTFACDDPEFLAGPEMASHPDYFVMKKYCDLVHAGCKQRGERFLDEFYLTTKPIPFALADGEYRFI